VRFYRCLGDNCLMVLQWVMRWTLPNTASMRQNSIFDQTIYIGNIQDEA
jgi:hypothetical protein